MLPCYVSLYFLTMHSVLRDQATADAGKKQIMSNQIGEWLLECVHLFPTKLYLYWHFISLSVCIANK